MSEIKQGSVVSLFSNLDHKMTVGSVSGGYAQVYWYDKASNEVKTMSIPLGALISSR